MKEKTKILNKIISFVLSFIMVISIAFQPTVVMADIADLVDDENPISGVETVNISGKVTCGGTGVSNATVIFKVGDEIKYSVESETDGSFSLDAEKTVYSVSALNENFSDGTIINVDASVADQSGINLELGLREFALDTADTIYLNANNVQKTVSVSNPVSVISYNWNVSGECIEEVSHNETSYTFKTVKSGSAILTCTESYGLSEYTRNLDIEVSKVSTAINFTKVAPSEGTDLKQIHLEVSTSNIPNGSTIKFYRDGETTPIGNAQIQNNSAECIYSSTDIITGNITFTAKYAGINDVYEAAYASSNGIYRQSKPMTFVSGDDLSASMERSCGTWIMMVRS